MLLHNTAGGKPFTECPCYCVSHSGSYLTAAINRQLSNQKLLQPKRNTLFRIWGQELVHFKLKNIKTLVYSPLFVWKSVLSGCILVCSLTYCSALHKANSQISDNHSVKVKTADCNQSGSMGNGKTHHRFGKKILEMYNKSTINIWKPRSLFWGSCLCADWSILNKSTMNWI